MPAISLPWPGSGLARPCRTKWKENERGLEEEKHHFPRGPCMHKQLSLWPELRGINKLLRKQRTDLQPLFSRVRQKPINSRDLCAAAFLLPITASRFLQKNLCCVTQQQHFSETADIFILMSRKHASTKESFIDSSTSKRRNPMCTEPGKISS